jgi:hypothetical protein
MFVPDAGIAADVLPAPVSATFISKQGGKPPLKFIRTALVLTNSSNKPLWFVLPYHCDEPPTLKNPVRIPKGFEPTWICADGFNTGNYYKVAEGSKGKTIRLTVLNVAGDKAFCLFRLPPGGRVAFESYRLEIWSDYVRSFKVWIAEEITVNGKEPLQNWLPYETLSDVQTFVPAKAESDNLNWDAKLLGNRADFRKEPMSELDLKITGTWEIPLENFK